MHKQANRTDTPAVGSAGSVRKALDCNDMVPQRKGMYDLYTIKHNSDNDNSSIIYYI